MKKLGLTFLVLVLSISTISSEKLLAANKFTGSFRLPNFQLLIQYSKRFFNTVSEDPSSLFPDVTVVVSSADYLAGRDPVLETILAMP